MRGRSRFVQANGLKHHLLDYGDARHPAVLIVPGITMPAAGVDFIAAPLADLGFYVVALDVRGRGQTDRAAAGQYRLSDYAADLNGMIAALKLRQPILVGHSMGARIVAAYAARYAQHDHGLVVLVDPPVSGPGRAPYPTTREAFVAQLRAARAGVSAEDLRALYPRWPERELRVRAAVLATCDETAVVETHIGFESEDFFSIWKRMTAPAALIVGAESPVVTRAAIAELAQDNPAMPIHVIANAGHMAPWDNFDGFFDALTLALNSRARG